MAPAVTQMRTLSVSCSRMQSEAAAAQSSANCHFLAARGGAGNEKAGNVHGGDKQNTDGSGEKNIERSFVILHRIIEHEATGRERMDCRPRVVFLDLLLDCVDLGDDALERCARFDASGHD